MMKIKNVKKCKKCGHYYLIPYYKVWTYGFELKLKKCSKCGHRHLLDSMKNTKIILKKFRKRKYKKKK